MKLEISKEVFQIEIEGPIYHVVSVEDEENIVIQQKKRDDIILDNKPATIEVSTT